jgi:type IV pilus assembly protein PilZ
MDETENIPAVGKVVWITPVGAEGNRAVGVGIQFSDLDKGDARRKIEEYLAGGLEADRPTHTM